MKKIISLFQRNYEGDRLVRNEVVPGAEWVLAGEGIATRKFDGTCCLIRNGRLYKRCEIGLKWWDQTDPTAGTMFAKDAPSGFLEETRDLTTMKVFGWSPVGEGPEDRWHRQALINWPLRAFDFFSMSYYVPDGSPMPDGTYELCGPKVQGNPEGLDDHYFIRHGVWRLPDCPRMFDGLRDYLGGSSIEGVVWHRGNGDMVKIKRRDFFKAKKTAPLPTRT